MGGCDDKCVWCDSKYAVDPKFVREWTRMTVAEIVATADALWPETADNLYKHSTLSGGNPAIHDCQELIVALNAAGHLVGIETQGTRCPDWLDLVDDLTVSPKPPSSGNETPYLKGSALEKIYNQCRKRLWSDWMQSFCLKVVVFSSEDYEYAKRVHLAYADVEMVLQVGTRVGESTVEQILDDIRGWQEITMADPIMCNVRVMCQMHVLLRGHKRGI